MPHEEDVYHQAAEDGGDSQRFSSVGIFKVGAAVIGGACLVLLSIAGISILMPSLQNTNAAESTDLVGMPTSLRSPKVFVPPALASLPGARPWKELAIASIEAANQCNRDVSAQAQFHAKFNSIVAGMDKKDQIVMAQMKRAVKKGATKMVKGAPYGLVQGMVAPVDGLWDPFALSSRVTEGELLFFREAEIKHGRVCMLASLGFFVGEKFHPLFGGNIDVPSIQTFGQSELALFWPIVIVALGVPEVASLARIDYASESDGFTPSLMAGEEPGAIGFDPLGLKPDDPAEYLIKQNQELLHGRLAMIATAGFIAQEVLTQSKLNEGGIYLGYS